MDKKIEKLIKLEAQAKKAFARLEDVECNWLKAYDAAKNSPEWNDYCKLKGIENNYNFNDIVC